MVFRVFPAAAAALLLFATEARAEGLRKVAPAGGGLGALEVELGADAVTWRRCANADCSDAKKAESEKTEKAEKTEKGGGQGSASLATWGLSPDAKVATIDVVPVGEGRSVVHVRIPDAAVPGKAFELIVSAKSDAPIFEGVTGYAGGDGERQGKAVVLYDRDAASKFVVVADVREDTRICGQDRTPLAARGLDPKRMELRGATLHRIEKKAREEAVAITATARASDARPELGRLLQATGGSSPGAASLTDGDASSTWSEDRPGDGHGEFVTMRAPVELPLEGLVLTIAPKEPKGEGAAPRTLFVATDKALFRVTIPEDAWSKPGASYDVALPSPVTTSCVAVVLDEAYEHGKAPPVVSIAEVNARTTFDREGASLTDVARALGTSRRGEAEALLRRAGPAGAAAVASVFASLDVAGRTRAVEVASASPCDDEGTSIVARALADGDTEVRRKALGRVERCGKSGAAALAKAVREGTEAERAAAAPYLAMVAPTAALAPLSEKLGEGSVDTRRAVRSALARAAASRSREELLPLLAASGSQSATARIDLLRALAPKLSLLEPEATAAIDAVLAESTTPATRYLLAAPLAELSLGQGDTAATNKLVALARRDPEWSVRARAVEVAAKNAKLASVIVEAVSDPHPRVREAALVALRALGSPLGKSAAVNAIAKDEWTFVRAAAFDALAVMPRDRATEQALESALEDKNPLVRLAAVGAIGKMRVTTLGDAVVDRLDDRDEYLEVRVAAARTLGAICMQSATDRLTELAERAKLPVDTFDDRIGFAAIEALGAIHPPDLATRLAPLRDKNVRLPARLAADRALASPPACR